MIVSPRSSHSTGIDVVRDHVAIVGELSVAESAHAALSSNLPVHQLSHFGIRPDFSISARVLRIIDAPYAHLAVTPFP